jgi:hypothetical protein
MTHNQFSQRTVLQSYPSDVVSSQLKSETREAANMDEFNTLELVTALPAEDILSRMHRLRALANLQNNRANSAKRQQISFAF